jgi:hypothetical protein
MVEIVIKRKQDRYYGLECKGHAGEAKSGTNIVCAALSVLCINAVNSVEKLTDDPLEYSEDDGFLSVTFPNGTGERGTLLMESLILGIEAIETQYGKPYVHLSFEEV